MRSPESTASSATRNSYVAAEAQSAGSTVRFPPSAPSTEMLANASTSPFTSRRTAENGRLVSAAVKTKAAAFSCAFAVRAAASEVTGSVVARNLFTAISDSSTSSTVTANDPTKFRSLP